MTTVDVLMSKIRTDRQLTNIHSTNISNAEVTGYTRKSAETISQIVNGEMGGVRLSAPSRSVDKVLQLESRRQNTYLNKTSTIDSYMQRIGMVMGTRGDQNSFSHDLGRFVNALNEVTGNISIAKKSEAVNLGVRFANNLQHATNTLNTYRGDIDNEIAVGVNSVNDLIGKIAERNKMIVEMLGRDTNTTNIEDERDVYIQELGAQLGVRVNQGSDKMVYIYTTSGTPLVQSYESYPLSYNQSNSITPGQTPLPGVTQNGLDITASITQGRLSGLFELRDSVLLDLQAEFDELTRVVRDTVNALHNEGGAINGQSTLTGTTTAPGLTGPLNGSTIISGNGAVRLGVIDKNGTLIDYKDIPLTANMTVTSLLSDVNAAAYGFNNASGAFNLTQLASGELQLSTSQGNSVIIGAAGPTKPTLNLGSSYDATTALGFSHFFGLNNFFETPGALAITTPQVGIANTLQVRADIVENQAYMALGRLNSDTPPLSGPGLGLGVRNTEVCADIASYLQNGPSQFNAAGLLAQSQTSSIEFSERIISVTQQLINDSNRQTTIAQKVYDELAMRANEISGVNTSDELMELYRIQSSIQITGQALAIYMKTIENLFRTIGNI